jgi:methionyl-tRNA synthetase
MTRSFYITTPIYYVNDRPHIGHVYTTTIADVLARYRRLTGDKVFFLTGTDEHAAKVVDAAAQRGLTAQQWADQNAQAFEDTFHRLGIANDDFIRTSQPRHKERVQQYVKELLASGDVYLGEYEGWYDAGQEEYLPESKAKEYNYQSPFNKKPLVRKKEKNYFFKLSSYGDKLLKLLDENPALVKPDARRNEVIGRIREGLNDVPISRTGGSDWGIRIPGDEEHVIYVWIDALFNYISTVDTDERRGFWPANVHLIAKDILWFHAVIWPAMLMALQKQPGREWVKLPGQVYAHSFWISEGQKMSKSMGNFIDLEKIDHYVSVFGLDALRYFLTSNGPMGTTDSDFAEAKFIETYNTDLANTLGNCSSRIGNMINRYFAGKVPPIHADDEKAAAVREAAAKAVKDYTKAMNELSTDGATAAALDLVRAVDNYIEQTQPFKLAKDPANLPAVGTVLYNCAEAIRIASVLLWPVIPGKIEALWQRLGLDYATPLANSGQGFFNDWTVWGLLIPDTTFTHGDPLFPRYQAPR